MEVIAIFTQIAPRRGEKNLGNEMQKNFVNATTSGKRLIQMMASVCLNP